MPKGEAEEFENKFYKALSDDLNMPKALGIMWEMIKSDNYTLPNKKASLLRFDEILGLDLHMAQDFLANKREKIPGEIIKLMEERNALQAKRYLLADQWRRKIIKKDTKLKIKKAEEQ